MSRYRIGARAEYKLKHELERRGWSVTRAAGSHGKWDLIAVRKRNGGLDILLIQVKRNRPPKKPIISFYPNSSAIDCFIFVVPRKGAFLSRDLQFSVSELSSIVHQLSDGLPTGACHQLRAHTTHGHRGCRNELDRIRRKRACSR